MVYKHERITVKSSLIKNTFQTQDLKGAFIRYKGYIFTKTLDSR